MPRDYLVYLEDICQAIEKIKSYAAGQSKEAFAQDSKTVDAVVRNLEIIGEAVKKVPKEVRLRHSAVEWKKVSGLRDILIHEYYGVDIEIIWDIVINKLPTLHETVKAMIKQES
jgi:uncharacterized protein with HEPN domain